MKVIIRGKKYDTETAELIAEWSNGHYTSDFHYCSEDLYRTKNGNWFIHGDGGAMSKYATSDGNSRGGGSAINAISPEEALKWLEEHVPDKVEKAEKYFNIEEA